MALTAAQIAALQAEAEAKRAEADAAVAMAYAGYTAGYHALCADVDEETVNIPVSPFSAGLLYFDNIDDWRTALGIVDIASIYVPSDAITALDALTPSADTIPYFTGATGAALTNLSELARTLLAETTEAGMRGVLNVPEGTGMGNVQCLDDSVVDGALVVFDGTGGMTVKEGPALSADMLTFLGQSTFADMKTALGISDAEAIDLTGIGTLKALISDALGVIVASPVTSTELSKLAGIGSSTVIDQLNLKKDTSKIACGFATGASSAQVDKTIPFGKTFTSPPMVVTTSSNGWFSCRVKSTTTTGFVVNCTVAGGTFYWIAIQA